MKKAYQFKSKIDNLFTISKGLNDDEIKANLSRHLCILASGYLEQSFKQILMDYASLASSPAIQNYIESSIQNLTNLKTARIIECLSKFNSEWGKELEANISDEQKDAIDALVANRNNIAHGKDVGISFIRVKTYFDKTQEAIKIIERIVRK